MSFYKDVELAETRSAPWLFGSCSDLLICNVVPFFFLSLFSPFLISLENTMKRPKRALST